jgi:hypothetical protein
MNIHTQNTANIQLFKETAPAFQQANETGLNTPLKQIAQESKTAWLPNPIVHRLMDTAMQAQRTIASHLESSSSHIENLAIALEVLQDRNYQSAPSSTLRLQTTGQALGGAPLSKHEIHELEVACTIAEKQVGVHRLHISKIQHKHDSTSNPTKRKGYIEQLRERERDLREAQQALSVARRNLQNALNGASSSGGGY